MTVVLTDVAIGLLTISSRSLINPRDTSWLAETVLTDEGSGIHTVGDTDPGVPANLKAFVAWELTQAGPQSVCLKDFATKNI